MGGTDSAQDVARVSVQIYDQEYILKGSEPTEHLQMLAAYVDRQMREVGGRSRYLSPLKVAVLAALTIADTLSKLQEDYDGLLRMIEEEKRGG